MRNVLKTNVSYVGDLRHALAAPVTNEAPLRVYDARTGTEHRVTEIYVEDGVLCLDTEPTGEITEATA